MGRFQRLVVVLGSVGRTWLQIHDREHGSEPWLSEGTLGSTRLVRDLDHVGNAGSQLFGITPLTDRWFFFSGTFDTGIEPWITDGTEAGTHLVRDIKPGPGNGFVSNGEFIASLEGQLMFATGDGIYGVEPWITDATEAPMVTSGCSWARSRTWVTR